jgi:ATP-dependent protease ClpP protease subunit
MKIKYFKSIIIIPVHIPQKLFRNEAVKQLKVKMISLIAMVILCCFINCCTYTHNINKVESIEDWSKSITAQRGYIYLSGTITQDKASNVIEKIETLNNNNSIERIRMVICTFGGNHKALDKIINIMDRSIKPVDVIGIGPCYSSDMVILAAATGKRYAFPDTTFILHNSKSADRKTQINKILALESKKYENVIKKNSNLPEHWFPLEAKINFFTEKEAKGYNLVNEIITELP